MTERVQTHPDLLRSLAQYDAMRNIQNSNVQAARGEHHEEAGDALIVKALSDALKVLQTPGILYCGPCRSQPVFESTSRLDLYFQIAGECTCGRHNAITRVASALKSFGK